MAEDKVTRAKDLAEGQSMSAQRYLALLPIRLPAGAVIRGTAAQYKTRLHHLRRLDGEDHIQDDSSDDVPMELTDQMWIRKGEHVVIVGGLPRSVSGDALVKAEG